MSPLKKSVSVGIALLVCSVSAQAAVTWTTWNLKDGPHNNNAISGDERTVGPAGNQTTATAWGNTSGSDGTANAEYRQLDLWEWGGGLGAGPGSSPAHSIGASRVHEFVLLEFDMPTTLTDLKIGWPPNSSSLDTDMTVLAFTGGSFTRSDMEVRNSDTGDTTGTTRGLTNAGWDLISNPMNVPTGVLTSIGNTNEVTSSYWLIGTYNNHLNGVNSNYYNDYFKLKAVHGFKDNGNKVPLPTTAALLGLGLLALGRKKLQAS